MCPLQRRIDSHPTPLCIWPETSPRQPSHRAPAARLPIRACFVPAGPPSLAAHLQQTTSIASTPPAAFHPPPTSPCRPLPTRPLPRARDSRSL
ncbi:hypothetical protein BBK36DRAFT_1135986 [Trichoderma citrinoviride]|uniref:Uncharacterized protein n=1 Tax=Trichoderma citrinoviride TaxID=58853 RepID=A0A2T4B4J8_9HYPO|nr:hypothetical protein BBK36DRAFT_1135986 [Trichoderma citrinoviride]PTB64131.1 hypothetical protein BBK36DRAFT_1135986 [Trichoderma citrinoviride]